MTLEYSGLRIRFAQTFARLLDIRTLSPQSHSGHSMEHDVMVAMMATRIALDTRTAEKAFVAGLLHSLDRVTGTDYVCHIDSCLLELTPTVFTSKEIEEIRDAVLRHSEHKDTNPNSRSLTLVTLMDADKLVNMYPLAIARTGQFYTDIPVIETEFIGRRNPASTYQNPTSIIENLHGFAEWAEPGWLQLPEAKRRGKVLANQIRMFIEAAEAPYKELGIAGLSS